MPRSRPVNPFSLPRPRRETHVVEIESEHGTFRFGLVKADVADVALAMDRAEELIKLFVGEGKEFPLQNLDDRPIVITASLCRMASLLSQVQREQGDDGEACDLFNAEEYLAMSFTLPDVYTRLQIFRQEIEEQPEKKMTPMDLGNSITASSEPASGD